MTAALANVSPKKIGWEPYIYLVYLGFLLLQPSFDPEFGPLEWTLTFALVAIFLPVYLTNFTRRGRGALVGIGAIALLGFAGMFANTGSSSFFIYAAAGAPFVAATPRGAVLLIAAVLGLVAAAFALSPLAFPERWWAFLPALLFAPIIGGVNIFAAERERADAALRLAHGEIRRLAAVAERERIARDLHDLLGHTLSSITLKSELAAKLAQTDPARAGAEMREVTRVSRDTLKEVREAVRGYRTRDLNTELAAVKGMLAVAEVRLEVAVETFTLSPEREAALALALREAVTNVVRHAHASSCRVELQQNGGEARLIVEDDGVGKRGPDGAGLTGMCERIERLGGTLQVAVTGGTRLELTLPVQVVAEPDGSLEAETFIADSPRLETT